MTPKTSWPSPSRSRSSRTSRAGIRNTSIRNTIHPQGELSLGRGLDPKRLHSGTAQDVEPGVAYAVSLERKFGELEHAPPTVLVGTAGLWVVVHR